MGLKDYGAWLSVVHDTPAQARVAGSWLSVVHDTPSQARVAGSWLSVVHDAPQARVAGSWLSVVHDDVPLPAGGATAYLQGEFLIRMFQFQGSLSPRGRGQIDNG